MSEALDKTRRKLPQQAALVHPDLERSGLLRGNLAEGRAEILWTSADGPGGHLGQQVFIFQPAYNPAPVGSNPEPAGRNTVDVLNSRAGDVIKFEGYVFVRVDNDAQEKQYSDAIVASTCRDIGAEPHFGVRASPVQIRRHNDLVICAGAIAEGNPSPAA
jgi:hypothetical protein